MKKIQQYIVDSILNEVSEYSLHPEIRLIFDDDENTFYIKINNIELENNVGFREFTNGFSLRFYKEYFGYSCYFIFPNSGFGAIGKEIYSINVEDEVSLVMHYDLSEADPLPAFFFNEPTFENINMKFGYDINESNNHSADHFEVQQLNETDENFTMAA